MEDIRIYYLAFSVEKRNPMPVDIQSLDQTLFGVDLTSLESIDAFTSRYTNDELMSIIRNSNILSEEYLNGELNVIDNRNHKFPVILSDTFLEFDIVKFISANIEDKALMNKIYNIYNRECKNIPGINAEEFNEDINNKNAKSIIFRLYFLPYYNFRIIELACLGFYKQMQVKKEHKKNN